MSSERNDKDVEIIPPDSKRRERDAEWIYISFNGKTSSFKDLPLHKRILLGTVWIIGLIMLGVAIFLIVASAVLIWIPLLLAIVTITGLFVFFRTKFLRR